LIEFLLVVDPGDQTAVNTDVGEFAKFVCNLLGCSDQRIAAMAGDKVRLMACQWADYAAPR
jgi:hypothetical protein